MVALKEPISHLLTQLREVMNQLDDGQYARPVTTLSGSTLAQHIRHILEFYIELHKGYETGVVDYDQRERDHAIETDKRVAIFHLNRIAGNLDKPDRQLLLNVETLSIPTNYYRELVYNLEHTVHHMALIRIGINAVAEIAIPDGFGIAASTLKYRQACAQ